MGKWLVNMYSGSRIAHWFPNPSWGIEKSSCGIDFLDYEMREELQADTLCKRCLAWKKQHEEK